MLEYASTCLYEHIPTAEQVPFLDQIHAYKTEGGNVILGKMLQLRLELHYNESIQKASEYISQADIWYICDLIGERVFGVALLNWPTKSIAKITEIAAHGNHWLIRSLGAGIHYANKKGLGKDHSAQAFAFLLTQANNKNKEIRQGIGWAAKTTAKFHPEIIEANQAALQDETNVANWFRRKVEIGLDRHAYAQRNRS